MVSKSTKVIRQSYTRVVSRHTDRACGIEKPSQELKNSSLASSPSSPLYWAHEQGLWAEAQVIRYYLNLKFHLISQRLRTPFAEVDLFFKAPSGHLVMVEVKSVNLTDFHLTRISKKQKQRLHRALEFLIEKHDSLIEIHWAFVTKAGEVTVIDDICG